MFSKTRAVMEDRQRKHTGMNVRHLTSAPSSASQIPFQLAIRLADQLPAISN